MNKASEPEKTRISAGALQESATVVGAAVLLGLVTGIVALWIAMIAVSDTDWTGAGVCLGAAALAFGLISNAILRR